MNYGYHGYSYGYGYGPMTGSWPVVGGGIVLIGALLFFVWIALIIWALIDLFKSNNQHKVAWAFVIILGKVIGPIGYYFIVAKDRHHK